MVGSGVGLPGIYVGAFVGYGVGLNGKYVGDNVGSGVGLPGKYVGREVGSGVGEFVVHTSVQAMVATETALIDKLYVLLVAATCTKTF